MKRPTFAFVALFMTASAVVAAEPAKVMETSAGKVYTDDKGMTLYIFDKDETNKSNCYNHCATNWPPSWLLLMRRPKANGLSSNGLTAPRCGLTRASLSIHSSGQEAGRRHGRRRWWRWHLGEVD